MKKKIEIEQHRDAFVGLNGRVCVRYEVRGYLDPDGRGWTGIILTRGNETRFTKTEAIEIANDWLRMPDAESHLLMFGQPLVDRRSILT